MLQEEKLRADLVALNDEGGGLLGWQALRSIARRSLVDASTRRTLGSSPAGRKLLRKIEHAIARHAKQRAVVFLAHSFHRRDAPLVRALRAELKSKHLRIITGEKPAPKSVSAKVLDRIDSTWVFIALFTVSPETGRPSPWIVSELGYAARKPRVVLLERPLQEREIGGIQGDIEYIQFSRESVAMAFKLAANSALEAAT